MKISIALFGPLKECFKGDIILEPKSAKISEIRNELIILISKLDDADRIKSIVSKSVFADENKILRENEDIAGDSKLVLLPPVCGG